ncbi:ferrochelatase [Paenibacillus hodogayensis]|uniref:Ferrochelatase n=1 Tax=Paenibacillus hodogayensis TaxID=279208 RepID=A0ABV5VRA9_9BACL
MKAVLMMAYCSLTSIDDIAAFYTHLHHGRRPSPEALAEAAARYKSLGAADPLGTVTARQARSLERRLRQRCGEAIPVYTAMRHTAPFVEETVRQLVSDGVTQLFVLPMTPLYSKSGVGGYYRSVLEAREAQKDGFDTTLIAGWHLHQGYVQAIASRLTDAMNWLSAAGRERAAVLFTTHSKPGLPSPNRDYIQAYAELADAVACQAGVSSYSLNYRSGGPSPQVWLGPDVRDRMTEAARAGATAVVVCDLLTIAENIEVVTDCRTDCMLQAEQLGLEFVSAAFPNDSDDFMTALEDIVVSRLLIAASPVG